MNRRGNKQRRVHFHAKRKRDAQRRKFSEAIFGAMSECFVETQKASNAFFDTLERIRNGPKQPIQGRFMVFPVTASRASAQIEIEMKKEALKHWKVHGRDVAQ